MESEDNTDDGESQNESVNGESDEDLFVRRKSTRKTAKAAVTKIKKLNDIDAKEENCPRDRRQKNRPSRQDSERSSDEEVEVPKTQKNPYQNGRKVDAKELKRSKAPSESQEQASATKQQVTRKKNSTTQDSEELSDVSEDSVDCGKRIKSEDEDNQSDGEEIRLLRNRKCASNTRKKKLEAMSDASSSQSEEEVDQRQRKKEHTSSDEWQKSDAVDKKAHPRRKPCIKVAAKGISLRTLPKKSYIMEDSDEEFSPEMETQSKNGKSKERANSRARKPSAGNSKRKRGGSSESEDTDNKSSRNSDESEGMTPQRKNEKRYKRLRGSKDSESDSGTRCKSENGRERWSQEKLPKATRQRRKQSESDEGSNEDASEGDGRNSESDESESDASSCSQSGPKRRLRDRGRGTTQSRKHKKDVSDEDSDVSYGKPRQATRIRTRNRGKRTVNYQDSEWRTWQLSHARDTNWRPWRHTWLSQHKNTGSSTGVLDLLWISFIQGYLCFLWKK